MAIEDLDGDGARITVADSRKARGWAWADDPGRNAAGHESALGEFGHDSGRFWSPADVAGVAADQDADARPVVTASRSDVAYRFGFERA